MDVNLDKEVGFVESVLFLDSEPLSVESIVKITELSEDVVERCLEILKEKYAQESSGVELSFITGGWTLTPKKKFFSLPSQKPYLIPPQNKEFNNLKFRGFSL